MTKALHSHWSVTKQLLAGLFSRLPGGRGALNRRGTGTVTDAAYGYNLWQFYLSTAHACTDMGIPRRVAEIGPGNALAAAVAALVSGCEEYIAVDAVAHAKPTPDPRLVHGLVDLYQRRASAPSCLDFPDDLLTDEHLRHALAEDRIEHLGSRVRYQSPWTKDALPPASVDMVWSHAVMERVDNLDQCYAAQAQWLAPGGTAMHFIDFDCHWTGRHWNGHWARPDWLWGLMRGQRSYLINRVPCSEHLQLMRQHGLELVEVRRDLREDGVGRSQLARRFANIDDQDLHTQKVVVVARKRSPANV